MKPNYACYQNDDGTWFVNQYAGPPEDRRRDTIYDGLTEDAADWLVDTLNLHSKYSTLARWDEV